MVVVKIIPSVWCEKLQSLSPKQPTSSKLSLSLEKNFLGNIAEMKRNWTHYL